MRTCVNKHITTVLTSNIVVNKTKVYCRFAECSRCIFFLRIETIAEADGLTKKMEQLETALMTVIWHNVLDRFNATSASLQKADIDLLTAMKLYHSLLTFVEQMRETFDDMEIKAKSFGDNPKYKEEGVSLK